MGSEIPLYACAAKIAQKDFKQTKSILVSNENFSAAPQRAVGGRALPQNFPMESITGHIAGL